MDSGLTCMDWLWSRLLTVMAEGRRRICSRRRGHLVADQRV